MALFIRPANVQKNVAATFTIDYAELAAHSKVPAGYYKDTSNWKRVLVKVKNKASNQKNIIEYVPPSTNGELLLSDTARSGDWELHSIIIQDYDRGEVVLHQQDIPTYSDFDFLAVSSAAHGDLIVRNGEEVSIPANATRQYGDLIVEAGGTLKIGDGGGILDIEVLGNCIINGQVLANNGKHTGGTWTKTSKLGETLSFNVVQKAGGAGGQGESIEQTNNLREPSTGESYSQQTGTMWVDDNGTVGVFWEGQTIHAWAPNANTSVVGADGWTYHKGTLQYTDPLGAEEWSLYRTKVETITVQAVGGDQYLGNGGGGSRSAKFGALEGGDAIDIYAGAGANAATYADEYGEDGPDATQASFAAGGGFRGAHGQAIWIKAYQIQGSGSIVAAGQAGGNGGDGGEFLSEGELYANGPGGGGAGGDGGKVWLRVKKGTPSLTIDTIGGEKGARGLASAGAVEAGHGVAGANGSYDLQTY